MDVFIRPANVPLGENTPVMILPANISKLTAQSSG